jgi:hypothetical protein
MNVSIASIDFWEIITKPSLQDFYTEPRNYRKMVVAIWATDALIEHICWEKYSDQMKADDRAFLEKLANDNINYKTVHEASNSLKHSVRTGKKSLTKGSNAIEIRPRGWGEAEYGVDEWNGPPMGLITFLDGRSSSLKFAMENLEKQWIARELGIDSN